MARTTGLNWCSPLPCVFRLSLASFFLLYLQSLVVFSRKTLCDCAQTSAEEPRTSSMFFVCYAIRALDCGTLRAPSALTIDTKK